MGFDHELTVLYPCVFEARIGVVLELFVADIADLVAPFIRIGQAGVFKLVAPDQFPLGVQLRNFRGLRRTNGPEPQSQNYR